MADNFSRLSEQLKAESDRGSVVLAAAWMDDQLTQLLLKFMLPPLSAKEDLIRAGSALGDVGTKISLAYRLGLIRPAVFRSLNILRRLRNDFAHLSAPLSLDTDSVKDRVTELFKLNEETLRVSWEVASEHPEMRTVLKEHSVNPGFESFVALIGYRGTFNLTAAIIVSGLSLTVDQVEPVPELS